MPNHQKIQLWDTVRKFRIYPALFSLFLIPEMAAMILFIIFGINSKILFAICAAFIGSMGTAVAFNYLFIQRGIHRDFLGAVIQISQVINPTNTSTTNTASGIGGQSISKLLNNWGSNSNSPSSNSTSNKSNQRRIVDAGGDIALSDGSSLYTGSNSSAMTHTNESTRPSYIDSAWDSRLYSVDENSIA